MKIVISISLLITLLVGLLITNLSVAEEISFSDEELAKEVLPSKTWICLMDDDQFGEFETRWTFTHIKGNKVKAKILFDEYKACNTDSMKGKLKKNVLKFNQGYSGSCYSFVGTLKFFRDESNQIKAKGNYRIWQYSSSQLQCE